MSFREQPRTLQLYIVFLTLAAIAAFVQPILYFQLHAFTITMALVVYAILAFATARVNIKIPYTDVHFSMDTAFIYAILMIYGTLPAMIADAFSKVLNTMPHVSRRAWFKLPFNVASGLLSVYAAGLAYHCLLPSQPHFYQFFLPLFAMAMAYFVVNSVTVALAISFSTGMNLIKLWIENFLWTSIGFFAALSIAILIYVLHRSIDWLSFLVSVPIIVLVMFTQRISLRREEDNQSHIRELETMHMNTIETLSLAIDAKDQTTHGHVHRVTAFLTRFAGMLGVTDEKELQGLRFAALVHDIGKIAIPDIILAKPGRFTAEEMERMKVHPAVGAQIVKAVSKTFPISDIILSHHERWDGKGYPNGIAGEQIGRYSRMLAVCDVYDALRSDRPYRTAMSKEKALSILADERGKGFDPDIVDVFMANVDELEAVADAESKRVEELTFLTPSSTDPFKNGEDSSAWHLYGQISHSQQEMYLLYEVAQMVGRNLNPREICAGLITGVAKLIPYNTAVVFLANQVERTLTPTYIESRSPDSFAKLNVPFGQGITGWVAQNAHPLRNVPPHVELASLEIDDSVYLAALSVPFIFMERTVGVVTLYSEKRDFYQDHHQELLFKLANMVTPALINAMQAADALPDSLYDRLTGVGNLHAMRQYFDTNLKDVADSHTYTMCLLDVRDLRKINAQHGHDNGDRVLVEVARTLEGVLRPEDRCFRYGGDEFVVVAHGAGKHSSNVLIDRLRVAVRRLGVRVPDGVLQPQVSIGVASFPDDGRLPEELLRVADAALYKDRLGQADTGPQTNPDQLKLVGV